MAARVRQSKTQNLDMKNPSSPVLELPKIFIQGFLPAFLILLKI